MFPAPERTLDVPALALSVGMDHTLADAPDVIRWANVTFVAGFLDTQQAHIGSNNPQFSSHLNQGPAEPSVYGYFRKQEIHMIQVSGMNEASVGQPSGCTALVFSSFFASLKPYFESITTS